jgi:hypothetical protein
MLHSRSLSSLLLGLACLTAFVPAWAQGTPYERFFTIEWHVEQDEGADAAIVGYLRNDYLYSLRHVELQAQIFDDAGEVTDDVIGKINRDVPPGGRVTFRLPLETAGVRYAVVVHAFEFGERQSP